MQRLFTAGSYDKFFRAVSGINRTLITESYRTGDGEQVGIEEQAIFPADPRTFDGNRPSRRNGPTSRCWSSSR